jgi:hypothetical protein
MTTPQKIFNVTVAGLGIWWWLRLPKVKVLSANGATGSVSYKMSINGKSIQDTYVLGDAPQFVDSGDGMHWFGAFGNATLRTVDLGIGYFRDGGFKVIKGTVISF